MVIIAIIFFLVYVVGIPLIFWLLLWYNTHTNKLNKTVASTVKFLHEDYAETTYWYEMIWMARRALISAIISFFPQAAPIRRFLVFSLAFVAGIIHIKTQPFNEDERNTRNRLEYASWLVIVVTCISISDSLSTFNNYFLLPLNLGLLLIFGIIFVIQLLPTFDKLRAKSINKNED